MAKTLRELTGWGGVRLSRAQNQKSAEHGLEVGGVSLPKDLALRIHEEVAALGWCTNWDCPCTSKGYQQGQEDEREQSHEH